MPNENVKVLCWHTDVGTKVMIALKEDKEKLLPNQTEPPFTGMFFFLSLEEKQRSISVGCKDKIVAVAILNVKAEESDALLNSLFVGQI